MKKIIQLIICLLFVFFIPPSFGQSTIPSDEIINQLINNCFTNFSEKDKEYNGDEKIYSEYNHITYNKKSSDNGKLSEADNANGITYRRIINVKFIYKNVTFIYNKLKSESDWADSETWFDIIIKNGELGIYHYGAKEDCGRKIVYGNSDKNKKPNQQELDDSKNIEQENKLRKREKQLRDKLG